MVYRVYVEKKPALAHEANGLLSELRTHVGITALTAVRLINRYDVENIDAALFAAATRTIFSEPQLDMVSETLTCGAEDIVFAVEPLPGQFDQRADSAAQCIQLQSQCDRPTVRSAKVYVLSGELTEADVAAIKKYVINAVESREASLEKPDTLAVEYAIPETVATVEGFISLDEQGLSDLLDTLGLAMDLDDLKFLQAYFRDDERRDPTITEIRVVDTYWSDHCRHTTFSTVLDNVVIHDPAVQEAYERYLDARVEVYGEEKAAKRPQTLMDIATIGAKTLKKRGLLPELDESEEINACSIHVTATVNGKDQDWLLMFKNETHNHPTEIEPFGGAATCIGGCIRDPLSGRAYVHQAMRVTGAADPRVPLSATIPGSRTLPADIAGRGSSHHSAALQPLGYIAIMVKLGNMAGGQADLIAIGGIAGSCSLAELALGQLAGQGFIQRDAGISGTGNPHGLVDIGTPGQGIPDAAADTGGCAAEGLDLRGVVVGFILEHQKPILVLPIDLGGDMDGAGIDLFAFVQLREQAPLFQGFGADGGDVHQGLGPPGCLFFPIDLYPGGKIALISCLDSRIVDLHIRQHCGEGGMAAMVRPVGIHHPDFGDGGVPVLVLPEIALEEFQIIQIHGKAQLLQQSGQSSIVHGDEALHSGNGFRSGIGHRQGLGELQRGLPAFHRVDHMLFDGRQLLRSQASGEHIHLCGADDGAVPLGNNLDALGCRVRPLVILAGQGLHGKDNIPLGHRKADGVHLGLGKHSVYAAVEQLIGDVFRIIAVQDPDLAESFDPEKILDLPEEAVRLVGLALSFFNVYAINHGAHSLSLCGQGTLTDIGSAVSILENHALCQAVGLPNGSFQGIGNGGGASDASAGGDQPAILQGSAGHIGMLCCLRGHGDLKALLIGGGVALGGIDHAAGMLIRKLYLRAAQGSAGNGLHNGKQVAFQQREHHLGFRIAKAAVILNDLGSIGSEHQAEVQAALEGAPLRIHGLNGRKENLLHAHLGHSIRIIRVGSNGAHAAGIQAGIPVPCPLVVHGRNHGHNTVTIGKGQNADLRTGEKLLDHHTVAAGAEDFSLHHGAHSFPGLLPGLGNDHALTQGQAVSLDDRGNGSSVQIAKRRFQIGKNLVGRGGDAILLHKVLGENLAALDDGSIGSGAEAGNPRRLQSIHAAQHQRIIRCDHRVIHSIFPGKPDNGVNILCPDIHTGGIRGNTAIAGQGKYLRNLRILFQTLNDGMLPATTADN